MWFSYPREESWIPLPIERVKEIQRLNKDGIVPPDLGEVIEIETNPVKILDYENVVGQDSLTRLDDRRGGKKKNKNRNKNRQNGAPDNQQRQATAVSQVSQPPKTQGPRPDGAFNNNRNKKFRPNRNNQNRPGRNDNPDGHRDQGSQPDKQE